jgi:hypothetical protein
MAVNFLLPATGFTQFESIFSGLCGLLRTRERDLPQDKEVSSCTLKIEAFSCSLLAYKEALDKILIAPTHTLRLTSLPLCHRRCHCTEENGSIYKQLLCIIDNIK